MYGTETRGKLNTGNARPVYTRGLPPGRKMTGAEPGLYGADGSFVPWKRLNPSVTVSRLADGTDVSVLTHIGAVSRTGVLVLPQEISGIGERAFAGSRPDAVVFPQGLVRIGEKAFDGSQIRSAVFPPSLKYIGGDAFRGTRIRTAVLPERLGCAGGYCFSGTDSLRTAVLLSPDADTGTELFAMSGLRAYTGICPGSDSSFADCTELVSAVLTSGTAVPDCTFLRCRSLMNAEVPADGTVFGNGAFSGCPRSTADRCRRSRRAAHP